MFKSGLCHIIVVHLQQGRLTLSPELRVIRMSGNHLIISLAIQWILRRKEPMGLSFLMCFSVQLEQCYLFSFAASV